MAESTYAERMAADTDRRHGLTDRRRQLESWRLADERALRTVNCVLAALGGGILTALTLLIFGR